MVDAPTPGPVVEPDPREHSIKRLPSLLEKAEKSSRALERAIFLAVTNDGRDDYRWNSWLGTRPKGAVPNPEDFAERFAPPYTRSIDAALTLVPEGMGYIIIQSWHRCGGTHASVTYEGGDSVGCTDKRNGDGNHRSTPIALCIAALRARAAK